VDEVAQSKQQNEAFENSQYSYLIDPSISDFERFVRYVNENEGEEFISVQQLTELLGENI
jgi:hypothetical protein